MKNVIMENAYKLANEETKDNKKDNKKQVEEPKEENTNDPADKDASGLDEKKKKWYDGLKKIIGSAVKNYAKEKTGKWLNELFLGNFKDAVIDVYSSELKGKLDDEKEVDKGFETLKQSKDYKKALDDKALDSRKDDNTNAEVDEASAQIMALWYSKDNEENIGKALSEMVAEIQKVGKKLQEDTEKLKQELSKMKIKLSDEEIANYGPVLFQMLNDKKSEDEIKKQIAALKKDIKESVQRKIIDKLGIMQLNESKFLITEAQKNQFLFEAVCKNDIICEAVVQRLIAEGFFKNMLTKAKNSKAAGALKDVTASLGKKMKDLGTKTLEGMTKYSVGPILSLAGIATGIATGGLGAELILKTMDIIERHGKKLRNTFERAYTDFANSKGVITKMNFSVKGDEKKKYSLRFYQKDLVWRMANLSDSLKHPNKDYIKQVLEGEVGKKYIAKLKKIWDPLFAESKGGKIDFEQLLSQAKEARIPEKALKMFSEFAEQYDQISANCIESPKIDTRNQDLEIGKKTGNAMKKAASGIKNLAGKAVDAAKKKMSKDK